jgi:predicted Zn-ribbon and HTH transcriptional regulator
MNDPNAETGKLLEAILHEYDLDNADDKKMYDEMLDECSETCNTCKRYGASRILEEMDPVAYRCGFNDYTDGLDDRWVCPICEKEHDDEEEAKFCCQEEPEEKE